MVNTRYTYFVCAQKCGLLCSIYPEKQNELSFVQPIFFAFCYPCHRCVSFCSIKMCLSMCSDVCRLFCFNMKASSIENIRFLNHFQLLNLKYQNLFLKIIKVSENLINRFPAAHFSRFNVTTKHTKFNVTVNECTERIFHYVIYRSRRYILYIYELT